MLITTTWMVLAALSTPAPYFQQEVAFEIEVILDDSLHVLHANEMVEYTNHSPDTLGFIWFHLWPNAYQNRETAFAKQHLDQWSTDFHFAPDEERGRIDGLEFMAGGQVLDWEFHPEWTDVARVNLATPLGPGETVRIETPFVVHLPEVFSRLGHNGKHYEITQWYPKPAVYDRDGWHPMPYLGMGEFYSEFGSFDVVIDVPADYRVGATGDLIDGAAEVAWLDSLAALGDSLHALDEDRFTAALDSLSGLADAREDSTVIERKRLHFHQDGVHDFAWFADPSWVVRKGTTALPGSGDEVTLWSFYLPWNAEVWAESVEYIRRAVDWYSLHVGDYPYAHATAVDGDLSAGGGMEYPNVTVISTLETEDLLEMVIEHEVGHNWFYGILGSNERVDPWMDEGLNDYTDIRYWETYHPDGAFQVSDFLQEKMGIARGLQFSWVLSYIGYATQARSGDDQPIDLDSEAYEPSNYGAIVYGKTGLVFRYLQHYLGEAKLDEILQDYYEIWKFRHPGPADFQNIVEKHVDEDLDWFFEDLMSTTRVVDYALLGVGDGQVRLANRGEVRCPVEVAFYDGTGTELERRWLTGFEGNRSIEVPTGTVDVAIDPDDFMPDVDRTNHRSRRPFRLRWLADQPDYHSREIYVVPWLDYNQYNGWMPGAVFYSGFVPTHSYGASFMALWDLEHQRPAGVASYQRTWWQVLGLHSLSAGMSAREIGGVGGAWWTLSGVSREQIVGGPEWFFSLRTGIYEVESDALDPDYYEPGQFCPVRLEVGRRDEDRVLSGHTWQVAVSMGNSETDAQWSSAEVEWKCRLRLSRDVRLGLRAWAGGFLEARDVPRQYRTWLSGGVDPDFEGSWVWDRYPDRSVMDVEKHQYLGQGPGLRGATGLATTGMAWGVNLDQTVPMLPVVLFADVAGTDDPALDDVYADAGFTLPVGPIDLHVPLYTSWSEDPFPRTFEALGDRLRFSFSLSGIGLSF